MGPDGFTGSRPRRAPGGGKQLSVPNSSARITTCHSRTFPVSTLTPSTAETRPSPAWVASSTRILEWRSTSSPA